jgi:ankyrin repeat protein
LVQHPRLIDPNNSKYYDNIYKIILIIFKAHSDVKSITPRVKEILALDPSYAHVTTQESHLSALLAAVLIQDEEAVDLILDNNADPDVADYAGRTPLWWAARLGNTAIVSSLMSFGASIDATAAPPVLHLAVISQRRSTVLAILRHPNLDINRPDKKQRTALHCK